MGIPAAAVLIQALMPVVNRLFPDKTDLEKENIAKDMAQDSQLTQMLLAQSAVNQTEAASDNLFKSGWRPAIGWACATAIWWYFFVGPILTWMILTYVALQHGLSLELPRFDVADLLTLTSTMLGVAWLRTKEKSEGIS